MKEPTYYDWVELIEGVLLTLCGFTTFLLPIYLPEKLILLFGVIATMIGIANIFLYVKSGHEIGISRTLALVGGILSILVGLLLASHTMMRFSRFAVLYSLWLIAYCLTEAGMLKKERDIQKDPHVKRGYWISVAGAIAGAILIIVSCGSLNAFRIILALMLVVLGVDRCVLVCKAITKPNV